MQYPIQPTTREEIAEHGATASGLATTAAIGAAMASGSPLDAVMYAAGLALLPALYNSISSKRIQARNEAALISIRQDFETMRDEVKNFTDSQFGFISETVISVHAAHEAEKLEYLKKAIFRAARDAQLVDKCGALLARILRDITAAETIFLHQHFGTRIGLTSKEDDSMPDTMLILKDTEDAATLAGLISLGLIADSNDSPWDFTYYEWTRTAARILALIKT